MEIGTIRVRPDYGERVVSHVKGFTVLTAEETQDIERSTARLAKAFTRGIWIESYCISQCETLANQYRMAFTVIYNQFRAKVEAIWKELSEDLD